jgi:hypothetical protein
MATFYRLAGIGKTAGIPVAITIDFDLGGKADKWTEA